MPRKITIWACAAACADGRERTVLGLYRDGRCLLVSRPWVTPTTPMLLAPQLHDSLPLLRALVSVADYHLYKDVWYGEVATDWQTISVLTGLSRSTINRHLHSMAEAGLIFYYPGHGWQRPPLIRIYPYQRATGIHLIEPEASWMRSFLTTIAAKTLEVKVEPLGHRGLKHTVIRYKSDVPQYGACAVVGEAPIFIPDELLSPGTQNECQGKVINMLPGNAEVIRIICGVPGLEDLANMCCGVDPAVGYERTEPVTPETRAKEMEKDAVNWRSCWSESGINVVNESTIPQPIPGQLGVIPTWELVSDEKSCNNKDDLGLAPTVSARGNSEQKNGPETTGNGPRMAENGSGILAPGGVGETAPKPALYNDIEDIFDIPELLIRNSVMGAGTHGECQAPMGAAPCASAQFIRASATERRLTQEQLNGLFRKRGQRLNEVQWAALTTKEESCIAAFERRTGVPFCQEDIKSLQNALTLTSHALVLRGIRYASEWPEPPGYYVMRDGFAHVLRAIEKNKCLHVKAKRSRTKVTSASDVDGVMEKSKEFHRKKAEDLAKVGAPAPKQETKTA